jgi:hypothetical protein
MNMPIQLRMSETTRDTMANDPMTDSIAVELNTIRIKISETILNADDKYAAQLAPRAVAASNAAERTRRFLWSLSDRHDAAMSAMSMFLKSVSDQAVAAVPQTGHGNRQGYETAMAAARAGVVKDAQRSAAQQVLALPQVQDQASQTATAFIDAMGLFQDAIDRVELDLDTPPALRDDADADDVAKANALEKQIRSMRQPMTMGLDLLQRMNDAADWEKADLFADVLAIVATEFKGMKFSDTVKWADRRGNPSNEIEMAYRVENFIAAYKESRTPLSLRCVLFEDRRGLNMSEEATERMWSVTSPGPMWRGIDNGGAAHIFNDLDGIFQTLLGRAPNELNAQERKRRYYSVDVTNAEPAWQVRPGWHGKFLPPSGMTLPGWSRVTTRTSANVPLRARAS